MQIPKKRSPSSMEREVIQLRMILMGIYAGMKNLHPIHFDSSCEYGRYMRAWREEIKLQLKLKDDE